MNAISPPDTEYAASLRTRLWNGGWRPVPLYNADQTHTAGRDPKPIPPESRGKRPMGTGWEQRARRNPPEAVVKKPDPRALNTGLLADGLRILDFDIDDPTIVARLRVLAVAAFGETITRTRANSPRCAMVYRAAEGAPPLLKLVGTAGKIEVLGYGQQLHAFGIHPSGALLNWLPESPDTIGIDQIPAVSEADVSAFFATAAPLIGVEPVKPAGDTEENRERQANQHGAEADHLDVLAALAAIPNDGPPDWDHWNNVGMATWAATGDSLAGFAAWCAWSERHPSHDATAARERWKNYRTSPPSETGAGKLFRMARDAHPGWTKPSEHGKGKAIEPPAMSILLRSVCPAPPLPLAVFGPFWSDWIRDAAEGANAPPDYIALPLLSLASSLLGNARWVVAWKGWAEPPAVWCASVGNPSSGKSSGATPVTRDVLGKVEKYLSKDYPDDIERWHETASIGKAVLKQWEKDTAKAIKAKQPVPPKPPEAIIPPKPIRPRARVADVTVEKLAEILESLPKGVLYVRDELASWLLNLSRYANGGSDRPFWLESYVGGPMQVDRVKNPDPVFIAHLTVPVFGTIQPDRLADVLGGADDGLASRFLWAWPEAQPFAQPTITGDADAATGRLLALAALGMVRDRDGQAMPSYVHLTPDARDVLADFARDMQSKENTAHGLLKSSLGKARGQALRLAAILEYLWWCGEQGSSALPGAVTVQPEPPAISSHAMQAAAGLMEAYFLPMAQRVLGDASIPEEERNARTLATWIAETRPERVNVSSIRDGARLPGLRESAPVKAACKFLAEARWLIQPPSSGTPGRPRGDYIVNPRVWEMTT